MIKQIEKNEVFENILNEHDVYCVGLNEVTIKWANEMTVDAIVERLKNGCKFITDEKERVTGFTGRELRRIDPMKFYQKLHDDNINKAELARLSGVNPNTITQIAKGSRPRKETLEKICKVLKCSADDLLEE